MTASNPNTKSDGGSSDAKSKRSGPSQDQAQQREMVFVPYEGFEGPGGRKEQLRASLARAAASRPIGDEAGTALLDSLLGTSATQPAIKRHARLIGDHRLARSANIDRGSRIVHRMQQTFGNSHVQRVLAQISSGVLSPGTIQMTPEEDILVAIQTPPSPERRGQIRHAFRSVPFDQAEAVYERLNTPRPRADDELSEQFHRLATPVREEMLRILRGHIARQREEEEYAAGEAERGRARPGGARAEERESRFLELPGPPLRGPSRPPRERREVRSGDETFRVGDRSGSWEIIAIQEDYLGTITLRVRNRTTRREQGWTLHDWHMQQSVTHARESTEAMADIAEAEVRILYELALPAYIRIPGEIAWIAFVCHQHRAELERLVEQIGDLHPTIGWLQENAPMSVQVFLVRTAARRAGEATPEPMSPIEIGREIGRGLRNLNTIIRFIVALTRVGRGSPAGVASSVLAFGGPVGRAVAEPGLRTAWAAVSSFRRLRRALRLPETIGAAISQEARGQVAEWAQSQGLTLDNPTIDQLIRENADPTTAERMIQVIDTLRNFLDISQRLSDEIDFERPATPRSPG